MKGRETRALKMLKMIRTHRQREQYSLQSYASFKGDYGNVSFLFSQIMPPLGERKEFFLSPTSSVVSFPLNRFSVRLVFSLLVAARDGSRRAKGAGPWLSPADVSGADKWIFFPATATYMLFSFLF